MQGSLSRIVSRESRLYFIFGFTPPSPHLPPAHVRTACARSLHSLPSSASPLDNAPAAIRFAVPQAGLARTAAPLAPFAVPPMFPSSAWTATFAVPLGRPAVGGAAATWWRGRLWPFKRHYKVSISRTDFQIYLWYTRRQAFSTGLN